jgi:predicted  nucleic acid-binding Zn-ribbon protein
MPVNDKLRPFLRLQGIDSERFRIRKAIEAAEVKREAPKKTLVTARNAVATAEAARLGKEKLLADAQLKLKVEEERLQKLEKQFLTLSSGREYKTMEHQIRGKKADKSLIEDEILHLMDDAETTRKAAADAKAALDKAEATAVSVEESVQSATREGRERLATLDREAAVAEKVCDPEVLSAYQMLLGRRNGLAITTIVNRICQGCYTSITAHEENKLLGGQLLTCGNCQRFMYLP